MKKLAKQIETLTKLRSKKALLNDQLSAVEEKLKEAEDTVIQTMMNSQIQSINLMGVGTVFLSKLDYPSIENVDTFYKYLRSHNEGAMIKETVHSSTLKSWWNDIPEDERPAAEEIGLGVYTKQRVSIRKG